MRASLRRALPAVRLAICPLALSAQTTTIRRGSVRGQLTTVIRTWTSTPTVGGLMSSIANADSAAARWTSWTNASAGSIERVDITPLVTAADRAVYAKALVEHDAHLRALRTTLAANHVFKTLLANKPLTNATPVAVEFAPEGRKGRAYYMPEAIIRLPASCHVRSSAPGSPGTLPARQG